MLSKFASNKIKLSLPWVTHVHQLGKSLSMLPVMSILWRACFSVKVLDYKVMGVWRAYSISRSYLDHSVLFLGIPLIFRPPYSMYALDAFGHCYISAFPAPVCSSDRIINRGLASEGGKGGREALSNEAHVAE